MYERLTECPLCKSGLFINHMVVKDHAYSQESFSLCKCNECKLIFTNPRPDSESIKNYYGSKDYISHQDKSTSLINLLYKLVREITIRQKLRWLNQKNKKKGRILDFGCGTGYFLKAAKKNGWQVAGVEPNRTAAKIAKEKNAIHVFSEMTEIISQKKFDTVTLFHVLEHIHDLDKTVNTLLERLKKSGTLFIAVPNTNSPDAKKYKENWASLDVPRHLYHFNQQTMQYFAEKFHLKIIDTIPMMFDSYYISILSDKIIKQEKNLIKSLINGYKSNQAAKKTNDYSSLLFILKKK